MPIPRISLQYPAQPILNVQCAGVWGNVNSDEAAVLTGHTIL